MSVDLVARGLAAQARGGTAALATLPRDRFDGSIVALGDSITANSVSTAIASGQYSDSWLTKGLFAMLVARSGGRLRPVTTPTWPRTSPSGQIAAVLVARGGSGYSPAATLSFGPGGGVGVAASAIVSGGVITGVTITAPGNGYTVSPVVTVYDPGGGTGAVLTAVISGTGGLAVGGIDSQQIEAFVPMALASGARNALLLAGTNDAGHAITVADSKASILATCQRLIAGGVRVIAVAPLDRATINGSTARKQVAELRRWMVDRLPSLQPGTVVVDPTPFWSDPDLDSVAGGNNGPPAGHTSDGLHPTALGADALAKIIWTQIAPLFPGGGYLTAVGSLWDAYDATVQPTGNLLANALVAANATGGTGTPEAVTAGEAPWTGTRGAKLFLTRLAGGTGTGTVAASQQRRSDGRLGTRQLLSVAVTGAAQGETYRLVWSATGTAATFAVGGANTLQIGDTVRAAIDEVQLANVSGVRGVKLRLIATNASTIAPSAAAIGTQTGAAAWGDFEDDSFPAWTGDTLFLQTRQLTIPPSTLGLTLMLEFVVNAGSGSFTAGLFGASVRKLG